MAGCLLAGVLPWIVEAACEIVGARYAALGVIGADGLVPLAVIVADDGVGHGPSLRRSGLGSLWRRAEQRRGQLTLGQPPEGGLCLR